MHALAGAFVPPDLAGDVAAAHALADGSHPYTPDIAARQARILNIPAEEGYPYFPHPPFAVALVWPIAGLGFSAIALIWFALSLGLLFLLAALLADVATETEPGGRGSGPTTRAVILSFALLLLWPPVLYNLEKGQFSIVLAVLIALAWRSLARGRSGLAGTCLGAAAAIKTFPILLAGYVLLRAPRALISLIAVGAIATLGMLIWMGPLAVPAYVQHSAENVTYWETWPAVTYSLHGLVARLFVGGRWAEPLMQSPAVARTADALLILFLVGCAARFSARSLPRDLHEGQRFAAWTVLLVLLNPVSMGHNGVLLALPIVLIGRAVLADGHTWAKLAWTAAVVLVSIPRQTVLWMAPAPLEPWQSTFVTALPMWGALLLFIVAVRRSWSSPKRRQNSTDIALEISPAAMHSR